MSRLTDILKQSEGKTLEYKRDLSSLKPVLKTLVAFANTSGGTVVIGIDDNRKVTGISDPEMDEERLSSAIADDISPVLLPDIEIVREQEKNLILVKVARFPGPFYIKSLGDEKGVYIRLGSTNRRASEEMLAELKRSRDHLAFDQLPCIGAEYDDLDHKSIHKAFERVGRTIDNQKLESLGVLIRYGNTLVPSNGGVILFGNSSARERFFQDAQVRCARFAGTEKVDFIDRLDIEGTVLDALIEVPKFIRRNTRMAAKIEGMRRQDIPEYPVIALREALTNAVAHTDYTLRGMQIMVAIFADRLEIQNPGMLPFGMTLDDLKSGVSRIRNPVIARVLRELDYMEKWGTGYKRIIEDCDAGSYPHPEWQELSTVMRVKFRPHPIQGEPGSEKGEIEQVGTKLALSRHQVQLLGFMIEPRSLVEMMTLLGWTDRTKFRKKYIKPLLDRNLIKMTVPDKPKSSLQKYDLTRKGSDYLKNLKKL